jgi:tRNA G10  N-methylase Trm11
MENFCVMELCKLKDTTVLEVTVGKVFFISKCKPQILLALKSVERLFITVFHCKQFLCNTPKKIAFLNLRTFLERDIAWQLCLKQWIMFQPHMHTYSIFSSVYSSHSEIMNLPTSDFVKNEQQQIHKKVRLDKDSDCLTFRVSCKSTGIIRRLFGPQRLSRFIGCSLANVFGWKVDLRNPQMEIYVHANEDYFTIGLPVVSRPLSKRKYLKHIALRSTVCYAMLLCAGDLAVGSILLDPMCGAGTLITEAAVTFQNIAVIGADIDAVQLHKAKENMCNVITASNVTELIHADVTNLPLISESVTSIVCDLPFGKKFGTLEEVKQLIPLALTEMNRVLALNGRVVLLISRSLKEYLFESVSELNKIISVSVVGEKMNQNDKVAFHLFDVEYATHPKICGDNLNISFHNKQKMCPIVSFKSHKLPVTMRGRVQWENKENHTIKLGEMFATICVFEKVCCS